MCGCSSKQQLAALYVVPNAMSHCSRFVKGHLSGQVLYRCLRSNGFEGRITVTNWSGEQPPCG